MSERAVQKGIECSENVCVGVKVHEHGIKPVFPIMQPGLPGFYAKYLY